MTTELERSRPALAEARPAALTAEMLDHIAAGAEALDDGEQDTRTNVELLSRVGLTGLGAPLNHDRALPATAAVIGELATVCPSTAFSVWAHRMTIEYLTAAGTPWSRDAVSELLTGDVLGVTGMASAFKDAAGCGALDLTAEPVEGGYTLSGTLRWASNLQPDSVLVTAARVSSGEKIVVALPLSTQGVTIGGHFDLLALGSTASSYLSLNDAVITNHQILSRDIETFLDSVRPTFLVLQSAMCVGLARRCLAEIAPNLTGVNSVFAPEVDALAAKLALVEATVAASADSVGGPATPGKRELLEMRLSAAEVVSAAAALETRTAGGKGYARRTDASRRYREAAFIPVQSPSEAQLRWELNNCQ
jgi:alkylation response protein AidB-like acyl-CoA dehydrogenase